MKAVLLDGSIGQELVKRSGDRATPLWSTSVMMEKPDLVAEVHAEYFAAGATIATTNTYAVHRDRLERVGLSDQAPELLTRAVEAANSARASHGSGRIAGALGPVIASYRPDVEMPFERARARYGEIVETLAPDVDLFLIETVASVAQGEAPLAAASTSGKPVWFSITVDDWNGKVMRSGEPVEAITPLVAQYDPEALLVNCSRPEVIADALTALKPLGKPIGAYANGFTKISDGFLQDAPTVDALQQRKDLTPDAYADIAMGWVDQGAQIIGGCCEVGPAHIKELARRLNAAGHEIVETL